MRTKLFLLVQKENQFTFIFYVRFKIYDYLLFLARAPRMISFFKTLHPTLNDDNANLNLIRFVCLSAALPECNTLCFQRLEPPGRAG
jgi:hypothetical protein